VSNIIAAQSLAPCFEGIFSPEVPATNPRGHHILSLDPDTPERVWRAIAHKLISAGCEVSVCEVGSFSNQPLEWYLADTPIQEVALHIITQDIPYSYWLESLNDKSLPIKEAVVLAEDIYKLEPDSPERNIALDTLGRRAGVSEYNWDKKYLDGIRARLESAYNAAVDGAEQPVTIEDRLTLEIKALLQEHIPAKRVLKINDISSRFRISKAQVYELMRAIGRESKTPECECLSLDELWELESEGIEYLIPGMLPRGETVLCVGMPKAGKTLLAIDAAFAVATGESHFLGEKVQQGKVLLVSVDESPQSTKAKLIKRGFRKGDQIHVMTRWDISQLDKLEQQLEDLRPDLVVIDSLKRITLGREVSENSAEFADLVYQLKELTGKYGAGCLLIHHSNKNPDAMGVGRIRGNTAIAGAVWGAWLLDRIPVPDPNNKKRLIIDPSDPRRTLSIIPRDSQGQNLKLELNPDNLSFSVSAEEDDAQEERKNQRQQILELLAKYAPNGLAGREILEELGLPRSAYNTLNRMVEQRLITQRQSKIDHRMMVYCLPGHSPSVTVGKVMTNSSQSTVVEPKTNSHHLVIKSEKISHQVEPVSEGDDNSISELTGDTAVSHQETPSLEGSGLAQPMTDCQVSDVSPVSDIADSVQPLNGKKLFQVIGQVEAALWFEQEREILNQLNAIKKQEGENYYYAALALSVDTLKQYSWSQGYYQTAIAKLTAQEQAQVQALKLKRSARQS
jgi:Fe2+ or Zn2+ uptake regulation protein